MRDTEPQFTSLSGSLLAAHPTLLDPNFARAVVLLTAHSESDGALGVILNRPVERTLGQLKSEFDGSPMGRVPVYLGGPVAPAELLLAAWSWDMEGGAFRLHFGISAEALTEMLESEGDIVARAFLGYAGWGEGQLEGEIGANSWILAPIHPDVLEAEGGEAWGGVVRAQRPDLSALVDVPGDPSLN